MRRIAVVAGDPALSRSLREALGRAGWSPGVYATAGRFLDSLSAGPPDAVVLDIGMPSQSAWDVIRLLRLRPETRRTPLVVLAAAPRDASDVVRALELGADECFPEALDGEVLTARLEALMRRHVWARGGTEPAPPDDVLRLAELVLWPASRDVRVADRPVSLTALEFDLLDYLLRHRDRVVSRGALLQTVWKGDPAQRTRTVDKRIQHLRRKLGRFGARIETVSRVGYLLRSAAATRA